MKAILSFVFLLFGINISWCNNIQVSNVSLTGQNTSEDFTMVEFDISWENSWRVIGGPNNWDAAWVFIKYKIGSGPWLHAWLNDSGHTFCGGASVSAGLKDPNTAFDPLTNAAMGVFIYRSEIGSGTFSCNNIQLRWNYGANNVPDDAQINIKVFAIEHVYIPEGAFKVGQGTIAGNGFFKYDAAIMDPVEPYLINSEAAITVEPTFGNLYYTNIAEGGDQSGPIPAPFPKGYRAFYTMKYEISQQGYVDFLNTLNKTQQARRVRSALNTVNLTTTYVMSNSSTPLNRNSIWTYTALPMNGPVLFSCNLNANELGGEINDGQNIACNYMFCADVFAYLDWAGLRPITELEYEKAGRGPVEPLLFEYAWGDTYIRRAINLFNAGTANETTDSLSNCATSTATGPFRNGCFAKPGTDRTFSGATYYGAMEFTGNLWEQVVSVGVEVVRLYEGHHGDGILDSDGYSNTPFLWGNLNDVPYCLRGASIGNGVNSTRLFLSNRDLAANGSTQSIQNVGGRGGRTAP